MYKRGLSKVTLAAMGALDTLDPLRNCPLGLGDRAAVFDEERYRHVVTGRLIPRSPPARLTLVEVSQSGSTLTYNWRTERYNPRAKRYVTDGTARSLWGE